MKSLDVPKSTTHSALLACLEYDQFSLPLGGETPYGTMKTLNFTYRNPQKIPTILVLVFLMVFVASCASIDKGMMAISDSISSPDPVTGRRQINRVSEDEEIKRAEKSTKERLLAEKDAGIKVDEETEYFIRVKTIFEKLQNVVHRQNLPWEVHVIEKKGVNAFTYGGGKVFVWTGLFEPEIGVQNDDELAAVLAHEMAHVAARHASEREGKLRVIGLVDKSLRDDRFEASFRTVQEDEADRYSVIYSALAGYDPMAGIHVWKRLHNAFGSHIENLLYTHPLNDDRAKNLSGYAEMAKQYYLPGEINPEHEAILKKNAVFSYKDSKGPEAGKGGGLRALLGTAANTYGEVLKTRSEEVKRKNKKREQERIAKIPITLVNQVEKLPASSWKGISLTLPYTGTLNLSVKIVSGNPVDIYLIKDSEVEKFKKSKEFQHYPGFQATKTKTYKRSVVVKEGVYYIIIRDTSLGLLSSSSTDFKITAELKP